MKEPPKAARESVAGCYRAVLFLMCHGMLMAVLGVLPVLLVRELKS